MALNVHAMGRKPRDVKPERLPLTVLPPTKTILDSLVNTGGYGLDATDAVRHILMEHIRRLERRKKIKLHPDALKEPESIETGHKK